MQHGVVDASDITIRFAGDSGDGMQLTGSLFADVSAIYGNSLSTFPDYPAEIRAPKGSISGVSGFQIHIGSSRVHTPGDFCDMLVAMNPAALKINAKYLKRTATVLVNEDSFDDSSLTKAGFTSNPFEELGIEDRTIVVVPISKLTQESLNESGLDKASINKCRNMFTLGMACYIYGRPLEYIYAYIEKKFSKKHPEMIAPNKKVLNDGFNYAANIQAIANTYSIKPSSFKKGKYRNITGNQAIAWGFIAAAEKASLPLFCGSYPITPATSILEELSLHKNLNVVTMQTEDEIAGICTAIGAAFAGNIAVTTTSGPGLSLKSEALGLAVMTELPLVIVDVQRGGPCTGLPTKTEQTDLNEVLYGRNGESPLAVIAAHSPSHCFDMAYMAVKLALEHMTPVVLLSEGFLGNGSEPWLIPSVKEDFPPINPPFVTDSSFSQEGEKKKFHPYVRDPKTLARSWAPAGTPGCEHRVGGLEKTHEGVLCIDPLNHELMVSEREEKINRIADYLPELSLVSGSEKARLLVVAWGGTFGHILSAVEELKAKAKGDNLAFAHFDYISPLPRNTAEVFANYDKILVCELNRGQFAAYLRAKLPDFKYVQYNKVQGQTFLVKELVEAIEKELV